MDEASTGNVATRAPWYSGEQEMRALPRALVRGTEEMRRQARSGRYLFPCPGEHKKTGVKGPGGEAYSRFELRVLQSYLDNIWLRSLKSAAGQPLRGGVSVDAPDEVQEWLKDMDGKGTDLEALAFELLFGAFVDGVSYVSVAYPAGVGPMTRDELDRRGIRPYVTEWSAEHAIDILDEGKGGHLQEIRFLYEHQPARVGWAYPDRRERVTVYRRDGAGTCWAAVYE